MPVSVYVEEIATFTCKTCFTELDIAWRIRPARELVFTEISQGVTEILTTNNIKISKLTLVGCPLMNNTDVLCEVSGVLSGTSIPVSQFSSIVTLTIKG